MLFSEMPPPRRYNTSSDFAFFQRLKADRLSAQRCDVPNNLLSDICKAAPVLSPFSDICFTVPLISLHPFKSGCLFRTIRISGINRKGPLWDSLRRADLVRRTVNRENDGNVPAKVAEQKTDNHPTPRAINSAGPGRGGVLSARLLEM